LTSVTYQGSNDPLKLGETDIFSGCNQLKFVCVPSVYSNDSFCELNQSQFCKHESCESFLHNHCFEPVCIGDDNIAMVQRENASSWESQSNACYEYKCYNDTGGIYWKQCNSTDKTERVCENDQCIVREPEKEKYYVEIEVEGINVTNLNMTEIQSTISNLTNIEEDKLRIRVDLNDKDEVTAIIVFVDDETTADIISDKINELDCNKSSGETESIAI